MKDLLFGIFSVGVLFGAGVSVGFGLIRLLDNAADSAIAWVSRHFGRKGNRR